MSQQNPQNRARIILAVCLAGFLLLIMIARLNSADKTPDIADGKGDFAQNPAIVTVNGSSITAEQLELAAKSPDAAGLGDETAIKNYIIQRRLLYQKALESGLETQPAIQTRLLSAREDILSDAMIQNHVSQVVTEEAIKEFYDTQTAQKPQELQVNARQIVVPDEAMAAEIIRRLNDGDSFSSLALGFSIDRASRENAGDLGYVSRDMMDPVLSSKIFSADKGALLSPVKTDQGWHVIEVLDQRILPAPSFESRKDAIEALLTAKAVENLLEELEQSAIITHHETPSDK